MIKRTRRSFTALVLILSILASLMVLTIPNVFADDAQSLAVSAATRNLFYSDYASAGYQRNTAVQDTDPITGDYYYWYKDDGLQRRSNCYGYSFRFFYTSEDFPNDFTLSDNNLTYKQLPGEFASKKYGLDIYDPDDTDSVATTIFSMADLTELYYDAMTSLSASDGAGNDFATAINLNSLSIQNRVGYIDYVSDSDYYYAVAPRTGTFTFSLSSNNSVSKTIALYNSGGTLLTSKTITTGSTSFSYSLIAGNTYILKIATGGQTVHKENYTYTFTISSQLFVFH